MKVLRQPSCYFLPVISAKVTKNMIRSRLQFAGEVKIVKPRLKELNVFHPLFR